MNVSGVAQEQMVSSFIMKKLNPLYLFFFQGLSGVAQRQIGAVLSGKSYIHCIYFSLTALGELGGSSRFSGAAQGHIGGSFIGKKLCPGHLFFFEYWGDS